MNERWNMLAAAVAIVATLGAAAWAQDRPQTSGAKGDQQRHYYFAEAAKELP